MNSITGQMFKTQHDALAGQERPAAVSEHPSLPRLAHCFVEIYELLVAARLVQRYRHSDVIFGGEFNSGGCKRFLFFFFCLPVKLDDIFFSAVV